MHSNAERRGLRNPEKKELAMQLVCSAENSTLDWRAQYAYIAYNVEHDKEENRGYTGGIIGFTSRTGDMLALVSLYQRSAPGNPLSPFLPALRQVNGSAARTGLGRAFVNAWKAAAADPAFQQAQDRLRDRSYFLPALRRAERDALGALGQFIYYDAMVMHGPGRDRRSFDGLRQRALRMATPPSLGGDETAYLHAFLDIRTALMQSEAGHTDTTRIDTMQRRFLKAGNLGLDTPLRFLVYGDRYTIV